MANWLDFRPDMEEDVQEYLTNWLSWHGTFYVERGW
jgi:hypothetical protein